MIALVTAEQMRAVEALEYDRGVTEDALTDRAARAVYAHIADRPSSAPIVVLTGPGNNGLDALKVHRLLEAAGAESVLHCWRRSDCPAAFDQDQLMSDLTRARTVLDGLFGIGLTRPVEGEPAAILHAVGAERDRRGRGTDGLSVVALDIPSGLNSDTGEVMGVALQADTTITLGLPKIGLYTGSGPGTTGYIIHEPIGLDTVADMASVAAGFDTREDLAIPPRLPGSHKNDNGRVMVIGGSLRYPGAPVIAALAAHRAGAGYVTVGFPRSMLGVIASRLLEQTLLPLPEAEMGTLGEAAVSEALEGSGDYRALVLGNGVYREDATVRFVLGMLGVTAPAQRRVVGFRVDDQSPALAQRRPMGFNSTPVPEGEAVDDADGSAQERTAPPTVVDGDGLFALATADRWWEHAPSIALLTPHPGEMARLVDQSVAAVESDRMGIASAAAQRWGKTVLLKGSYPLVARPDGRVEVLTEAHPELGTAGTGDVLAGLCGFLLALGLAPADAARSALVLGSRAARIAAERFGRDTVRAADVIDALPKARQQRER
ncbi:MAG: bifunctional ADP-dependent NAD(P)H-hydrate dehydratase/NAD(P)H-hydrate epimerase [Chloroflexota bacterium]|nr:bifunctional ADP-dependent NAD(P)H-hydrate dehydratase/NAD(P)H-hydrate epimerase [Chloroflexota bacterium]